MSLEWDAVGEKFFETGVSKVALFLDPTAGVAWNGVQNISVDPQGGEPRSYYFDGVKYLETTDAEDFQATITALQAPAEFRRCEGERLLNVHTPGMYVPGTGIRDKFHLAWRTQIGNDILGPDAGYWLHISYNGVVQPMSKQYSTLGDITNPDARSWVYRTTPACGRFSYFKFNSLECDLTRLEAEIASGNLPPCGLLYSFVDLLPGGDGGGGDGDPDFGCTSLLMDFENYQFGVTLSADTITGDVTLIQTTGVINTGINTSELPANGAFQANDSAATETGSHPVLTDDDDATYVTSANGDLGYTIALPQLIGYKPGVTLELHIRMSVSGGVDSATDDSEIDADAQVFITTDADGDLGVGGFSDGTDDGMSFSLSDVDGNIVDYVVPLNMDAWLYTTQDDVGSALTDGAYLNVVAASNNNPDTTPEVRVYEASVVMVDDTDSQKWLRAAAPDFNHAHVEEIVYTDDTLTEPLRSLYKALVDFKMWAVDFSSDAIGYTDIIGCVDSISGTYPSGEIRFEVDTDGNPLFNVYVTDLDTPAESAPVSTDVWYTLSLDFLATSVHAVVVVRETGEVVLDTTIDRDFDAFVDTFFFGGFVGNDSVSFESGIDNARTIVHCYADTPAAPEITWTCFDLSTAVFFSSSNDTNIEGAYDSGTGRIKSKLDNTSFSRHAQFHFAGFTLDPTKTYEFKAVYAAHTYGMGIYQENPAWPATFWSDNDTLASTFADTDADNTVIVTVGPGINQWNQAITDGYQTLIRFDMATNGDTGTVGGADLVSLCYREV